MAKSKHSNINHNYCVILKRTKKTFTGSGSDCMTVVATLKFISPSIFVLHNRIIISTEGTFDLSFVTLSIYLSIYVLLKFTKSLFVSLCSFVFFLFHQTVSINRLPLWFGGLAVECVLEDGEVE